MKLIDRACSPAFIVTAVLLVVGIGIIDSNSRSFSGTLFMVPFALGPLVLSLLLALVMPNKASQITLIIGSVLYAGFFIYLYGGLFHRSPSPQSGIGLLFIGFHSLHVMIPIWCVADFLRLWPSMNSLAMIGFLIAIGAILGGIYFLYEGYSIKESLIFGVILGIYKRIKNPDSP